MRTLIKENETVKFQAGMMAGLHKLTTWQELSINTTVVMNAENY
jgi:hypothetical protein